MTRKECSFPGLEGAMETPFIAVCVNLGENQLDIQLPLGTAYRELSKILEKRFPHSPLVDLDTFACYCREVYLLTANFEVALSRFLEIKTGRLDVPYVEKVWSFDLGEIMGTLDKPNPNQFARWHLLAKLLGEDVRYKYSVLCQSFGRKAFLLHSFGNSGPNIILIKEENGQCRICVANKQGTLDEAHS